MNTNRIIATGFAAFLIASCCTYDPSTDTAPNSVDVKEHIDLVGFDPGSKPGGDEGFNKLLRRHDQHLYRLQEYKNGEKVNGPIGLLTDITCVLENKFDYWAKHAPGKTSTGGVTKFAGRIGMSCSTSVCKPPQIQESLKMAEEFRSAYGPPLPPPPERHHHGD